MTRTQRTLDLMLFLQRWPRAFAEIRRRYPDAAERTIYRMLADVRAVAGLDVDHRGPYAVPVRTFRPLPVLPPDDDVRSADWPKRTDDARADIYPTFDDERGHAVEAPAD